ncbi:hypothetical protein EYF80_033920 [Liparis tanakae]|uniref:Uncharacterized protein n=1 Tax=Liparis tanakae TaxID=230148 RepID=A0A4Z2GSY7_9TELE|nr:hypothetical protein EYF80_033920 [Liparis tanakae]
MKTCGELRGKCLWMNVFLFLAPGIKAEECEGLKGSEEEEAASGFLLWKQRSLQALTKLRYLRAAGAHRLREKLRLLHKVEKCFIPTREPTVRLSAFTVKDGI